MTAHGFQAIWFWIAALLLWRSLCSSTLGAPNELLLGAGRSKEDAAIFDRLARRNIARTAESWRRGGVLPAALAGFLISFVAAYAVVAPSLMALDVFALIAPALGFAAASARTALALDRTRPDAEAVRLRFLRLRAFGFTAMLTSFMLIALTRVALRLAAY